MDARQIKLVQHAFRTLRPVPQRAAENFYQRLFALDPTARAMFGEDMTEQKAKLMEMLNVVLNGLDHLDDLANIIQRLGTRHHGYGATPLQYDYAETALLGMLEDELGNEFTPEVRQAWQEAYAVLRRAMLAAYVTPPPADSQSPAR